MVNHDGVDKYTSDGSSSSHTGLSIYGWMYTGHLRVFFFFFELFLCSLLLHFFSRFSPNYDSMFVRPL